jgi:class 3 adenylate cyclase
MENRILTIMFTDMKGYTSRTSAQSREATRDMITQHKTLLLPIIQGYGGRLVKTIGDAFLVTFESPTDAVLAGMALQKKLHRYNKDLPKNQQIEVRIAINTGEVIEDQEDVFGEAVNIASRIEGISKPNEIYFTESTYLSMNRTEVPSAEIGYRILKGIPNKIKIYKVLWDRKAPYGVGEQSGIGFSTAAARKRISLIVLAGALIAGLVTTYLHYGDLPSKPVVKHAPEEPVVPSKKADELSRPKPVIPPKKEEPVVPSKKADEYAIPKPVIPLKKEDPVVPSKKADEYAIPKPVIPPKEADKSALQKHLNQWNEYRKAAHGLKDKYDEIDRYFWELKYGKMDRKSTIKQIKENFSQTRTDAPGVFKKLSREMKVSPADLKMIKAEWNERFISQAESLKKLSWESRKKNQEKDYWRKVKSEATVAITDITNSVKRESPPADWETSSTERMEKLETLRQKIDLLGQRKERMEEYHAFRKKILDETEKLLMDWNNFLKGLNV